MKNCLTSWPIINYTKWFLLNWIGGYLLIKEIHPYTNLSMY